MPQHAVAFARQIDAQAAAVGWAAVHEELARVDPAAAARIHVNDPQRIQLSRRKGWRMPPNTFEDRQYRVNLDRRRDTGGPWDHAGTLPFD